MQVGEALRVGIHQIGARLEAELLLAWVLEQPRSRIWAYPEQALAPVQWQRYQDLLTAYADGAPLAYLTGQREFWSLTLNVTPATLIPRPDTETLVAAALAALPATAVVADLGTGSGAVALALAHERPGWRLIATDRSLAALHIARANAQRLGIHNVAWLQADWGQSLAARQFDAIVSNPPYLAAHDPHLPNLRHEPRSALVAGPTGLEALAQITAQAGRLLKPGGWLWLEHGYDQAAAVQTLLRQQGYTELRQQQDLAGWIRVSAGQWPA